MRSSGQLRERQRQTQAACRRAQGGDSTGFLLTTAVSRVMSEVKAALKAPRAASPEVDATHAADSASPTAVRSSG